MPHTRLLVGGLVLGTYLQSSALGQSVSCLAGHGKGHVMGLCDKLPDSDGMPSRPSGRNE